MAVSVKKLAETIRWSPYGYWDENGNFVEKRHEGQIEVLEAYNKGAEEIVVMCGTRWGKTEIASFLTLKTFLDGISEIKNKKKDSIKIWVVAPSYELTKKVFENVVKWFLKIYPQAHQNVSYRPFPQIKMAEGVWIQGKSATEVESLLGEELDFLVVDEASRLKREVWENYLYARLTSRNGRAILISTPFGRNWFWEEYLKAKEKGFGFNYPTISNPYFPKEKWEEAKKRMPEKVFNQEFMAMALEGAASVFRGVDEIIRRDCLMDVMPNHRYVMGVDLARHNDYTVLIVVDKWNHKVVYFDRFKNVNYPFQKKRIKAVSQRYNNAKIIIDGTTMGEPVAEDLKREGLFVEDVKVHRGSKQDIVEKLSIFIEQKQIWIPQEPILVDELKSYGCRYTEAGNVVFSAPHGMHDDCVMALALAVWGLYGKATEKTPIELEMEKTKAKLRLAGTRENYI